MRPRACRSLPEYAGCRRTASGDDGCPAAVQAHRSRTGHESHAGRRAVQTTAPNSITAADQRALRPWVAGQRASARWRSAVVMCEGA